MTLMFRFLQIYCLLSKHFIKIIRYYKLISFYSPLLICIDTINDQSILCYLIMYNYLNYTIIHFISLFIVFDYLMFILIDDSSLCFLGQYSIQNIFTMMMIYCLIMENSVLSTDELIYCATILSPLILKQFIMHCCLKKSYFFDNMVQCLVSLYFGQFI